VKIAIETKLEYEFEHFTDVLLQVEAAPIPEQIVEDWLETIECEHFARIAAHDAVGNRIWLRVQGRLIVDYRATVAIERLIADVGRLPAVPHHLLPSETVQYLMPSRYCPSDQFQAFVDAEFGQFEGGARVAAIRDWVQGNFSYVPGSSFADTTALDTFVKRQGVCRDYAHVMIALVRACGIPARIVSCYAPGVEPQDFHAVAEVFLDGAWHMVDATGMATEASMAKIGIGRDAADVAFLTAYGVANMVSQSVMVRSA
jgi:transglutaminase-like putative cysteine protease